MSLADDLETLASLRERGVLSEDEFRAQKARLLAHGDADSGKPPAPHVGIEKAGARPAPPSPPPSSGAGGLPRFNPRVLAMAGVGAVGVLAAVTVLGGTMKKPSTSSAPPDETAASGSTASDTAVAPSADAAAGSAAPAVASSVAPSNWCTPGVRLNVRASENSFYAGTVKRAGEAGLCVVGEDGWGPSWDRAVPVTQVASEGSTTLFSSVGNSPSAVIPADPNALSIGVYACSTIPAGPVMSDMGWGILDVSTYSDHDGGRGSYSYDPRLGQIDFTSGKLQGRIRRKDSSGLFHAVEADHLTNVACPFFARDPARGHW